MVKERRPMRQLRNKRHETESTRRVGVCRKHKDMEAEGMDEELPCPCRVGVGAG